MYAVKTYQIISPTTDSSLYFLSYIFPSSHFFRYICTVIKAQYEWK